jgi:hypothetical protein
MKSNDGLGAEYPDAKFILSMVVPDFSENIGWRQEWDAHVFVADAEVMAALKAVMDRRKETESAEREFLDLVP